MPEITPEQLATRRRELAQEYKSKMIELGEFKKKKAIKMIEFIDTYKTNAKAKVYYDASEAGQKEIELEYYCKGLIELMRSVKTEIEMKSAEAWGKY